MIPVKLALRNFMPYRGNLPPLRFEGIHIACITGDNGSGKSALIDAITWAVWGRTRARSGSDDDLIHLGQSDMEVEFDFTSGPNLYRIIRKHSRPKLRARSGQTALEFQVATGDGFQSISGNSITQTQQKIIATLRMDYDTFINSAFLRQGHADEFTIKGPAERKQVLADILGFSLYDELEERAKELARQRETEKAQLEIAVADIDKELLGRPACETELAHGQQELSRIELIVKETESRLNALRQEKGSLENKKAQLAQVERQIAGYQRDLDRWAEQVKQHRSRLEEYAALIAGRTAIEDGYRQFTEARRLYDELSQKSVAVLRLNERKSDLEKAIDRAQSVLLTEHTVLENRINELEAIFQKLSQLKDESQGTQNEWNRLAGVEVALLQKRQASQDLRALVHQAESSNARLEKEIGEIEDKLRLLLTGGAHKCPLCESELGVEGLKLIEAKYTADKSGKHSSLKLGEEELARHRLGLKSLEDEVRHLEVSLKKDGAAIQSKTS
ncbi:MAG: SMC family ATPase, partial [Dehalococcoidales bacterium]|nr:SMC family ATPase [Dehalococcoidales bacterium]